MDSQQPNSVPATRHHGKKPSIFIHNPSSFGPISVRSSCLAPITLNQITCCRVKVNWWAGRANGPSDKPAAPLRPKLFMRSALPHTKYKKNEKGGRIQSRENTFGWVRAAPLQHDKYINMMIMFLRIAAAVGWRQAAQAQALSKCKWE